MSANKRLQSAAKIATRIIVPIIYGAMARNEGKSTAKDVKNPKRILLLNGAHIGDVVIATSVIPILRSAYPSAEIGFVCGSWSQMVVKNHPELTYTHCVDHWRLNRSTVTLYSKMRRYSATRRAALKQIRELQYDVAISLLTYFPDFLDIGWAANIPVRIGFRRSLLASLATDLVDERESPFVHQGEQLAEPLRALPIDPAHFRLRQSTLAPSNAASIQEVCSLLGVVHLESAYYRIVHMSSANVTREFSVSFWRDLAERLSPECKLLFTGQGKREQENIAVVIRGLSNCINACGRLTWDGFVAAVRHAEVLYGVESMAGHVAGAVGTPCVVAYGGAAGVARWRPEGKDSIVFTNHVPCAPCYLPMGCAEMRCKQGFVPGELIHIAYSLEDGACLAHHLSATAPRGVVS